LWPPHKGRLASHHLARRTDRGVPHSSLQRATLNSKHFAEMCCKNNC
jgi:hypothetical protein